MKIVTWNVNSIRARLPRLLPWLEEVSPEVVCLQETKVVDELFPREPIEDLGYEIVTFGQKTYNGVAILSTRTIDDVQRGLGDERFDHEARVIGATIVDVMVLNLYVVNGKEVGCDKYEHKLAWLDRLAELVTERYDMGEKVVLTGDFNITFDDKDVYNPERWHERILCSTPEREVLTQLMETGLQDSLRTFHPDGGVYTWWDFRRRGFEQGNKGLRIDHLLMSPPALAVCTAVEVDRDMRAGPKPSDHAPVTATLA